eukprot:175537-Rhodomonas_salina.1
MGNRQEVQSTEEEEVLVRAVQLVGINGQAAGGRERVQVGRRDGPNDRTIQRATILAQKGNLGKAMMELTECGLADDPDEEAVPILRSKHPPRPTGQAKPPTGRRPAGAGGVRMVDAGKPVQGSPCLEVRGGDGSVGFES